MLRGTTMSVLEHSQQECPPSQDGEQEDEKPQIKNTSEMNETQRNKKDETELSRLKLPPIESTIIDIPSSAYDTDSSSASSTCCTRHGEHIYMQQRTSSQVQHKIDMSPVVHFKVNSQKSWPIFILLISVIEVIIFVYDLMLTHRKKQDLPASIPTDSVFIYRPDRRLQIWRFISYMFLHANWFHLGFNVVVQLFYGVPLEIMHGSLRVAVIYLAGVFAGSLGTSVVDSEVYLVGASGGVYALLAAHLANITLNYGHMKYAVAQLVSVVIFVSCDLGYTFYTQYITIGELSKTPPVSYIAHLTGALAGLTIGLLVLKNFERHAYENLIWWMALGVYCAFTVFAIVFNLINTVTAQLMEEQGEVITQHLLHDLGVS